MLNRRLFEAETLAAMKEEECGLLEKEKREQEQRLLDLGEVNGKLLEQNAQLKEDLNIVIERKHVMQKELASANQYVLTMEEKVYKSNKIALELLKRLKDAEVELDTRKQYAETLKLKIQLYKPLKGDEIDQQLADFVNNSA